MGGTHRVGHHSRNERLPAGSSRQGARPSRTQRDVPTWESFPAAARQQLVNVILQAARRQALVSAVSCRPTA
jgi:hypothetical protein